MTMYDILNSLDPVKVLRQINTLIAGKTGAGKSSLLNLLIYTAIQNSPEECKIYFIDPKKASFERFTDLPHCMGLAEHDEEIIYMLDELTAIMEKRYLSKDKWADMCDDTPIYVFIDELADLTTGQMKKHCADRLSNLARKCRASNIHIIACAQSPERAVIPTWVQTHFTCKIALQCSDASMSRMILGTGHNEAATLPEHGQAYVIYNDGIPERVKVPFVDTETLRNAVEYWESYTPEIISYFNYSDFSELPAINAETINIDNHETDNTCHDEENTSPVFAPISEFIMMLLHTVLNFLCSSFKAFRNLKNDCVLMMNGKKRSVYIALSSVLEFVFIALIVTVKLLSVIIQFALNHLQFSAVFVLVLWCAMSYQ